MLPKEVINMLLKMKYWYIASYFHHILRAVWGNFVSFVYMYDVILQFMNSCRNNLLWVSQFFVLKYSFILSTYPRSVNETQYTSMPPEPIQDGLLYSVVISQLYVTCIRYLCDHKIVTATAHTLLSLVHSCAPLCLAYHTCYHCDIIQQTIHIITILLIVYYYSVNFASIIYATLYDG